MLNKKKKSNKSLRFFNSITKSVPKQLIFFVISMLVLVVVYVPSITYLQRRYDVVQDNFSWVYQIDKMYEDEGKVFIKGWAFKEGMDSSNEAFDIILENIETKERFYPKMEYSKNDNVNDYFKCEYDYKYSGFLASISTRKLDLDGNTYTIILRPKNSRLGYYTGLYYSENELSCVNPNEFCEPEIEGTDLERIIRLGKVRYYNKNKCVYIYQYENDLYWIIDGEFQFLKGNTDVQYQMSTTQIDKLPSERLENNWLWDNRSFKFEENELLTWNTGKYRVAKCSLPTEYAVTKIWTGYYVDEWIWRADFRPWYNLE
ncbi:MAG: hypothetical protein J6B50_11285 [Lachnospiraceae bacterium]|nr:hypothetical protein [Lachnospiraceae bacterium]MBP3595262.1 hypothetical protein [Lachnospiraceae bacterium]